jgi:hypothetical protein
MTFDMENAMAVAHEFHKGQLYGNRGLYTQEHLMPVGVMCYTLAQAGWELDVDPQTAGIVGILHDVLEDTECTFANLVNRGVPNDAIGAICLMTHEPGEERRLYIRRGMTDPYFRLAKWADNWVNTNGLAELSRYDPERASRLDLKYQRDRATMRQWRIENRINMGGTT